MIAGIAVAGGAEPDLGPLAACYVLLLAVCGPLEARIADRPARRASLRASRPARRSRSHGWLTA